MKKIKSFEEAHKDLTSAMLVELAKIVLPKIKPPLHDRLTRFFCRHCGNLVQVDHSKLNTSNDCCIRHLQRFMAEAKRREK